MAGPVGKSVSLWLLPQGAPGMIVDDEFLDEKTNNYVLALAISADRVGLSYLDISTGSFRVTEAGRQDTAVEAALSLTPSEILLPASYQNNPDYIEFINEIGEIPVDGKIIEESGMQVKDIGGGCICCEVASTFAKTIYRLYKDFRPDHVLVEPTGVAVPHQVKLAARMGGRDAKISLGPAIVLFDATRPAELLDMDMLGQLVTTQVKDADMISISKVDAVDDASVEESIQQVRAVNAKAEIYHLSSFTGFMPNSVP